MKPSLTIAKALADGNRMRVLAALMDHEELCVCQIVETLRITTATISRHMSILQNAGLVRSRKEKRWVYYSLAGSFPDLLRRWLIDSLSNSSEIKEDRKLLATIVSCSPEELCRHQKERKQDGD
jgi:ArsR family transcriptional regulator, arsenate/arsenite/antimonite-responsive transcriptional repressor